MFSVVIPLYNKANTIIKTLNSVLAQKFQKFEIIIVDDGSTDNGISIIENTFFDKRIKIFQQTNSGVSAARNKGIELASFDWIALLDGDDEWHPDYLLQLSELIIRFPNAGLFVTAGIICNADKSITYRIAKKYIGYRGEINIFQNPSVFCHTSATIINKKIFNKSPRFIVGMNKFEDYLTTQCIALCTETVYCGVPLTKYNGGIAGQLTQRNRDNPNTINYEIMYYNLLYNFYRNRKSKNKSVIINIKYMLRHSFKIYTKNRNYDAITHYKNELLPEVKRLLYSFEWNMYLHHHIISIFWINFTKVLWRFHNYPIVGQKININKIDQKYLNW